MPKKQAPDIASRFQVEPAFSGSGESTLFALCTVLCLALPLVLAFFARDEAAQVYKGLPGHVNYHFIGEEIEAGDKIDVLIVGASGIWTAIEASVLSEVLAETMGRDIKVVNFGANWAGHESYYARVLDTLRSVEVGLVLLPHQSVGPRFPHQLAQYVWRPWVHPVPDGVSLHEQAVLYATGVLGAPYRVVNMLYAGQFLSPKPSMLKLHARSRNSLGSYGHKRGWLSHKDRSTPDLRRSYTETDIPVAELAPAEMTFGVHSQDRFNMTERPYTAYQSAFIRATAEAAHQAGSAFAMLSIPTHFEDAPLERAMLRPLVPPQDVPWPQIGISMTSLFPGRDLDAMKTFYANETHLNPNGARHYARSIAPVIAELLSE